MFVGKRDAEEALEKESGTVSSKKRRVRTKKSKVAEAEKVETFLDARDAPKNGTVDLCNQKLTSDPQIDISEVSAALKEDTENVSEDSAEEDGEESPEADGGPLKSQEKNLQKSDIEITDISGWEGNDKAAPDEPPENPDAPNEQSEGQRTLFVGNLSFSIERPDIENFFKAAGEVTDVRFGMNPDDTFRGFGHVEFATAEQAEKALLELNGMELLGRRVKLDFARERVAHAPSKGNEEAKGKMAIVRGFDKNSREDQGLSSEQSQDDADVEIADIAGAKENDKIPSEAPENPDSPNEQAEGQKTLFVGNLSFSIERSDIVNFFKVAGEVTDVRFGMYPDNTFKGFGHVEFATPEQAEKALLELNGTELLGRRVKLDLARERGAHAPSKGNEETKGRTAFVRGFNKNSSEDEVRSLLEKNFESCGEISRISIPKDGEGLRGMAYIEFNDGDALNKAMESDGFDFGKGPLSVEEAKPRRGGGPGGRRGGRFGGGGRFRGGGGGRGRF